MTPLAFFGTVMMQRSFFGLCLTLLCILSLSTAQITNPPYITYEGTVRDFSKSHPDFQFRNNPREYNITTNTISPDRKPVYLGKTQTTHSAAYFNEWYRDVPGVNIRFPIQIQLDQDPDNNNIYSFSSSSFFPINGRGWGNEGFGQNYFFTMEIHNQFFYRGGEVFTFRGDDDVWVYINNRKVIDIGGVHSAILETISLDDIAAEIGIEVGRQYPFDFFFAERHCCASNFRIDTTIIPTNFPPVAFDDIINTLENRPVSAFMRARDPNVDDTLSYFPQSTTTSGQLVTNNETGEFTYTPRPFFFGQDSFVFRARDDADEPLFSSDATVTILVTNINDPPISEDLVLETNDLSPVAGTFPTSDPDDDPLIHTALSEPEKGSVEVNDRIGGVFTYTPERGEVGSFTFTYSAYDGEFNSEVSTVTINVTAAPSGLTPAAIGGIVAAAALVLAAIIAALAVFVLRPRWAKQKAEIEHAFAIGAVQGNPLFEDAFEFKESSVYQAPE